MADEVTAVGWLATNPASDESDAQATAEALAVYAGASERELAIAARAFAAGVTATRKELDRLLGPAAETVRADALRGLSIRYPRFDAKARLPFGPDPEAVRIIAGAVRDLAHRA